MEQKRTRRKKNTFWRNHFYYDFMLPGERAPTHARFVRHCEWFVRARWQRGDAAVWWDAVVPTFVFLSHSPVIIMRYFHSFCNDSGWLIDWGRNTIWFSSFRVVVLRWIFFVFFCFCFLHSEWALQWVEAVAEFSYTHTQTHLPNTSAYNQQTCKM